VKKLVSKVENYSLNKHNNKKRYFVLIPSAVLGIGTIVLTTSNEVLIGVLAGISGISCVSYRLHRTNIFVSENMNKNIEEEKESTYARVRKINQ